MPEFPRRLTDRSDHDWPDKNRNRGIENRIFFTAPGEKIHFRAGTLETMCNMIRDLTWGDVMEILAQRSIVDRTDNSFYIKRVDGFGKKPQPDHIGGSLELILPEVIQKHRSDVERSLDITQREGLRSLVAMRLQEEERESHLRYKTPDMRNITPSIVDAVTDYMLEKIFSLENNWQNVFREVCGIIFDKIKEGGGRPIYPMVNSWTGAVLEGVRFHPIVWKSRR